MFPTCSHGTFHVRNSSVERAMRTS
jgi:hypothetical protein